jgi:glycerophosphoryl diester phosphodiesterase
MPHRHDFSVIVSAHQGYPRWINSGADFIEVDIRRSGAGEFIVSHDETKPGANHVTLREVLENAAGRVGIQLDLKEPGYELELIGPCPLDRLVVTTPDRESIVKIKTAYPQVHVGLTRQYVEETDADFIALDQRHATDEALDFCAQRAIPIWVWTVDDEKLMKRFVADRRVAGLITNRPDLALRLRSARS